VPSGSVHEPVASPSFRSNVSSIANLAGAPPPGSNICAVVPVLLLITPRAPPAVKRLMSPPPRNESVNMSSVSRLTRNEMPSLVPGLM
jgi:hypothetical protein